MKWQKVFEVKLEGIKCDAPDCDYEDNSVDIDEYQDYLNRPCPKCGASLLTEKDLATIDGMQFMERLFSWIRYPISSPRIDIKCDMDGSGKINASEIRIDKNE